MGGTDRRSGELFSYVDLEQRVRADHPLRAIRETANAALDAVSADFSALYSPVGRRSVAPEMLLRALLLQAFYSIRSERQLMERLEYDLLFRWFVGLGVDDEVWDHSTFSTNRDRLLDGDIAARFLAAVLAQPRVKRLLSSEHFSVDGTLDRGVGIDQELQAEGALGGDDDGGDDRRDGGRNAAVDFKGEKRSNATHASHHRSRRHVVPQGTGHGSEAVLHRPRADGEPVARSERGWAPLPNRASNGLIVGTRLTRVSGHAERLAALDLIAPHGDRPRAVTLGADKGYDAHGLREGAARAATCARTSPRAAAAGARRSTGAPPGIRGYATSQRSRKRIAEAFGWIKTVAGLRKTRFRGLARVDLAFTFAAAAYNLVRLPRLLAGASP